MTFFQTIDEQFPVRRTRAQKDAFLSWAVKQAGQMGYTARTETVGKKSVSRNLIIGSPAEAEVVYTAHYDTPTNKLFPSLVFPKNIPLFLLYTLGVTVVLLAIAFGAAALVSLLPVKRLVVIAMFLCVYVGLLLLMSYGPANQHNRNDNTAGVAALLTLMAQLPESARTRVAFILFDNKEQGCGGSKDYAKQHVQAAYTQLTVNFDGIGVGETFFTIASPLAQKTDFYPRLKEGFRDGDGFRVQHLGSTGRMLRGDDHTFKLGIGVMACKRKKGIGYYIPSLHTRHDTEAREENIAFLAKSMAALWQEEA
ncbi:MAG: M28 family peptidase [Clostridia bacterium]|nr:M28 family peptidase [Clostridia bacterium]